MELFPKFVIFSCRYSFEDPRLKMWIDFNRDFLEFDDGLPADYLSVLQYFPTTKTKKFDAMLQTFDEEIRAEFKAHRETYNPGKFDG